MPRHTYKTALRVKGIKPLPPYEKLRSHRGGLVGEHVVLETAAIERKNSAA